MKAKVMGTRKYTYTSKDGEVKDGNELHLSYVPRAKDGETICGESVMKVSADFDVSGIKIGRVYNVDINRGVSKDGTRWQFVVEAELVS